MQAPNMRGYRCPYLDSALRRAAKDELGARKRLDLGISFAGK